MTKERQKKEKREEQEVAEAPEGAGQRGQRGRPSHSGGGRGGVIGRGGGRRVRALLQSCAQTAYAGLTPSPSQPWNPHPATALQTREDRGSHTV